MNMIEAVRRRAWVTTLLLLASTVGLSVQGPWTTPPGSNGKVRIQSTAADALCVGGGAVAPAAGGCTGGIYAGTLVVGTSSNLGVTDSFRGLRLRTHQDADKAANQVTLIGADEIITDRGTRVRPRMLSADISTSGAGGLDTGSRVVSTWYEIYYLFKGVTASSPDSATAPTADALLFHRAKDYFGDTAQTFTTASDASRVLRLATSTATDLLAEGFKTPTSGAPGKIEKISLLLLRAGAVSGRVWAEIRSDNAGSPSSTVLATSDKIDASQITATAGGHYVSFLFRTPFATADTTTQYHLVLNGDYTRSDAVNIAWLGVAAGGYASGVAKEFNGASWANASGVGDFDFGVSTVRNEVAVSLPTGFTEKTRLGWVFNGSGNTLAYFTQIDRAVRITPTAIVGGTAPVVPFGANVSTAAPPTPLAFDGQIVGTSAGDVWLLSGIADGYSTTLGGWSAATVPGASASTPYAAVQTEMQGMYFMRVSGTGTVTLYVNGYRW